MSERVKGATSVSLLFRLTDSNSGAAKSVIDVTTLKLQYERPGAAASVATSLTLLAAANTAFTAFGAREIDATNSKGIYRVDCPDAAFTTGADEVALTVSGAGVESSTRLIDLTGADMRNAANLGLTALPSANPGAANGLHINGVNTGPLSVTGGVTFSNSGGDALALTSSGGNGVGLNASGNGTGDGIRGSGGATGRGIHGLGGATSGAGIRAEATGGTSHGLHAVGFGAGNGFLIDAGATGAGVLVNGGTTSGPGVSVLTTQGDGLSLTPTAGSGLVATGNGTSKFGAIFTGAGAGTSDGLKAVAGTGGVDIRGNITGNLAGSVATLGNNAITTASFAAGATLPRVSLADTLTTYTGNTPQTGDAFGQIGVAGVGLTNLGDARLADLDGALSTVPAAVDTLLTTNHGSGSWQGENLNLPTGLVQAGATLRSITLSGVTLGAGDISYQGRRLLVSLAAGGDMLTPPCAGWMYSAPNHIFTFAVDCNGVPQAGDVAAVMGV